MADARQLKRIHRVRTLQLGLIRADEVRAHDRAAREAELAGRIGELAAAVAPVPLVGGGGFGLAAAAHYRERLQESAAAADHRVQASLAAADRAVAATQAARRDQSAVEKLIARAEAVAVTKAIRALEDLPAATRGNRHDPC